jgi:hypothetical protein
MQIHKVSQQHQFNSTVLGCQVSVEVSIKNSYEASMDFSLFGRTYTFNVWTWRSRRIDKFVKLFHSHEVRDEEAFGSIHTEAGGVQNVRMTTPQKYAAVIHGCKDILTCLNKILNAYQRSVMDYAMWYRENHVEETDYSSYITLATCHCIVHSELFSPQVPFTLVKF